MTKREPNKEDGPYRPPNPADAPPYPPKKLAKKNKNKQGDPEAEYSKPLPGAPAGQNLTPAQIWREGDTSYS